MPDAVEALRSFNRFYTSELGVLGPGFLRTRHTLGEARVLFELGAGRALEVAELRARMAIDAGHLSRLLARLERRGLVTRRVSPADGRRRLAALTPAGERDFALLDGRSPDETAARLGALGAPERRGWSARSPTCAGCSAPARRRSPRRASLCATRDPATSAGSSAATASSTRASTAGTGVRGARGADRRRLRGAPDPAREAAWIAEVDGAPAGACCACADDAAASRSCACCSSSRGRAASGSETRLVDAVHRVRPRAPATAS